MQNISKETQEKIQNLQILEQNLQSILMQKQAFQIELSESENALKEVTTSKDEVYRLIGQIMIKSSKTEIEKELSQRKDILALRVKAIERQEIQLKTEIDKIKKEVMKNIK